MNGLSSKGQWSENLEKRQRLNIFEKICLSYISKKIEEKIL